MFRPSESWEDSARKSSKNKSNGNQIQHVDEGDFYEPASDNSLTYGINTGEKMPFDEKPNISATKPNKICEAFDFSFASIPQRLANRNYQSHNPKRITLDQGATPGDEAVAL